MIASAIKAGRRADPANPAQKDDAEGGLKIEGAKKDDNGEGDGYDEEDGEDGDARDEAGAAAVALSSIVDRAWLF